MKNNTLSLAGKNTNHNFERRESFVKPNHDIILGVIRKNGKPVTIALRRGVDLVGLITQFDKWTITIRGENDTLLTIYKSAIEYFFVEG